MGRVHPAQGRLEQVVFVLTGVAGRDHVTTVVPAFDQCVALELLDRV